MKQLLFLSFLAITLICQSQENEPTIWRTKLFTEPFERTELVKTFSDNEGGIYTIRYYNEYIPGSTFGGNQEGFIVQHWDKELNSLSYKNYSIKIDKKGSISGIFLTNGKLHVLEYVQNKKDKTVDCFVHITIPEKANFEKKKLFSFSVEKFPGFLTSSLSNKVDNDYSGNLSFSADKKYIVFNIDSFKKDQEKHKLLVYNEALELLWDKEFTHPTQDKLFDLVQIKIDNNGDVFVLGKIYHDGRKEKKKGQVNYHFELFKITKEYTETTVLKNDDGFIRSLNLHLNGDKLSCIGLYSNKDDKKLVGSSFFSIDKKSMALLESNFQNFASDFIHDKYGDEDVSRKNLINYSIDNIKNLKDEGYIITAEEFYVDFLNNQYGSSIIYHFNDIIIFRISKYGELLWTRNLNKKQSSNWLNRTLSYSTLIKDDLVYLFLNAHKKMGDLSENRKLFKSGFLSGINKNNSNFYLIKFNENGEWNSSIIQQNKTSEVMYDMHKSEIKTPNNSKIIFFGSYKKSKKFLAIEID